MYFLVWKWIKMSLDFGIFRMDNIYSPDVEPCTSHLLWLVVIDLSQPPFLYCWLVVPGSWSLLFACIPLSDWWRWTCPLQMTTQCTSPQRWWLWSAPPWRSNWHQVRHWNHKNETDGSVTTWMTAIALVQIGCDMFVGTSPGVLAQCLYDADLKREINRVWPNLSKKTIDLLVTPHKCEQHLCFGSAGNSVYFVLCFS